MDIIAVMTTTDSVEEARAISESLVEGSLAACVQVSSIESFYTWKGAMQNDQEYRLLIKTTRERYDEVQSAILELHSYDLPAIVAVEFSNAYALFADWVAESVE